MKSRKLAAFCLCFLLFPSQNLAQQPAPKKFELTVDSIMRGPDLVGYAPSGVYWSRDSQKIYFRWKRAGEPRLKQPDLYVVNRDGSGLRKLTEAEAKLAPPDSGELSKDKTLTVYTDEGDIFLYDHTKNERRQLTKTTDGEGNPHFTKDQKHIYFTRQNNLYTLSLTDGTLVQITDIRSGVAPDEKKKGTDSQEFIKKEERELLDAVKEKAQYREEQEAKRKAQEKRKPYFLPAGQSPGILSLTPDDKFAIVSVNEPARETKNTIVPNYVTESAFTEDIPARNKVGDTQGKTKLVIINAEAGEAKFIDHGLKEPPKNPEDKAEKPRERDLRFFGLKWSDDGSKAVITARSADNKDRWLVKFDPATAKATVLDHLHDDAWVNNFGGDSLGWLPDNKTIYFVSERDGYAHLYTQNFESGEAKQLTKGSFEISDVEISEDKTKFYITSSEGKYAVTMPWQMISEAYPAGQEPEVPFSSFMRHLYSVNFDGSGKTRITNLKGNNQSSISPDDSMLAIVRSYSNKPPELYLAANKAKAEAKQITTSPTEEFFSYNWADPRIVQIKARDGVSVPARIYTPAKKNGAAVIFVHGAGYLQNVHNWWSQYYREYMFHHLLMERGFVVLDIDYRGSAGYGRDWRTGIYRHMGGKDLSDHVDGAKYLVNEHGVDAKRIGIYGGSYGGFITLMAMFTEPDVFAAGAALRPVTDWAHYNHPYTANILNNPQSDAEAYKQSSPIYFANGLKGALLICHGMVDTNVHFQDSVRLTQKLIELRKENWELAPYPVEDHGFERASSWADEYKRILKLFENNLVKNFVQEKIPTKKR